MLGLTREILCGWRRSAVGPGIQAVWSPGPSLEGRCSSLRLPLASSPRLPVSRAKARLPRWAEARGSDLTADLGPLAVKHRPPFPVPPSWAREAERRDLGYPSPQPGSLGLEALYVLGRKHWWRWYSPLTGCQEPWAHDQGEGGAGLEVARSTGAMSSCHGPALAWLLGK